MLHLFLNTKKKQVHIKLEYISDERKDLKILRKKHGLLEEKW